MSDIDFESKFPDMKPLTSPPSLATLNGFGLTVYGARDFDEETATYVKTHCLCALFIPVLTLGAYRVADAPGGGWYFVGRVPLSALARFWNILVVCGILAAVGLIVWHNYTSSPDYLAGQKLAEADRLAAAGKVVPAAGLYREVALSGTSHAGKAMTGLKELLDGPVAKALPVEAAVVFGIAVELKGRPGAVADLFERALKLADQHAEADPRGALDLVDAVAPLAPNARALATAQQSLLEKIVRKESDNPEPATRLALVYEAQGQKPKCEALLARHLKRLGATEGARILGQIYASQGKFEQAEALLLPYTEERLKQFHAAEERVNNAQKSLREHFNSGRAEGVPYQEYQRADAARQSAIFQDYLTRQFATNPTARAARKQWEQEARVVPVAFDLGMVILRRAQALPDAAVRRRELEKAEKVFLAIRGASGESNLRLGQVYYWLGKHEEGRKQFDQLLKMRHRDPQLLQTVSDLLREVGATSEARRLAEEAYAKAKTPDIRYSAAMQRALLTVEIDDKITWLRRANPSDLNGKAILSTTLALKAMTEGKDEQAARHLREAIDRYGQLGGDAAILNNCAIAYLYLYSVTGDSQALDRRAEMMEKAVALKPRDSILLANASSGAWDVAFRNLIGKGLDLKVLRTTGELALLAYLYREQAGKDRYVERVRKDTGVARAVVYRERLVLLQPKSAYPYTSLARLHHFKQDLKALRSLARRLEGVELDLDDDSKKTLDYYQGKDDARTRKELTASIQRSEKRLAEAEKVGGATLAVAATTLVGQLTALEVIDPSVQVATIVALAEKAHAAAPSEATHSNLVAALLLRASRSLARKEPGYAALESKGRRSLGASNVIALALGSEGKVSQAALADKDVQRALTLLLEGCKQFPRDYSPWQWAMLRAAHPDEAARIAKGVLQDEAGRLQRSINLKLQPVAASNALGAYWALRIAGQEAEGRKLLKRCADRGVPLPDVPR